MKGSERKWQKIMFVVLVVPLQNLLYFSFTIIICFQSDTTQYFVNISSVNLLP